MPLSSETGILLFASFVTTFGFGIIQPILPIFVADLKASGFMLGLIFSAISISKLFFNPLFGWLSDKKGRKVFITSGLFIYVFIALSYTLISTPLEMLFVRLAAGVAFAMVMPIVIAYLGGMSKPGEESYNMAMLNLSAGMGMALGPIIGGILVDKFNMNAAFYGQSALLFVSFVITLFLLPNRKPEHKAVQAAKLPLKKLFSSNVMIGIAISSCMNAMIMSSLFVFMPLLSKSLKLTNTQIGILLATVMILSGVLQLPFGKLAGKYDKIIFIVSGSLMGAGTVGLLPMCHGFMPLLGVSLLVAIGFAMSGPALSGLLIEKSRGIGLGASVGTISAFQESGLIVGPILSGLIMDKIDLNSVFYIMAGFSVLATFIFFLFTKLKDNVQALNDM
jgi:MFS transporter, DHA1 family, multidrug resistance protein